MRKLSMEDFWEMSDRQLATRKMYRFWAMARCLCGTPHYWRGHEQRWVDQNGVVVASASPTNQERHGATEYPPERVWNRTKGVWA